MIFISANGNNKNESENKKKNKNSTLERLKLKPNLRMAKAPTKFAASPTETANHPRTRS